MEYKILKRPAMQIVGIEIRTSNSTPEDFSKLWKSFYSQNIQNLIPHKKDFTVLGLYSDYEKDHTTPFNIMAGCAVSSINKLPAGLVSKNVPATTYAVFDIKGDFPGALISTWQYVWAANLPRTFSYDFEVYNESFLSHKSTDMQLLIAIKDK